MSEQWQYQVRIDLAEPTAEAARRDPDDPALAPLPGILRRHNATLVCQYDAFANYVAEAERGGIENYPLYTWTRDTLADPAKRAKFLKSFTLYVDGEEVYAADKADALEAELAGVVGGGLVTRLAKHDTNPANNPQPPKQGKAP